MKNLRFLFFAMTLATLVPTTKIFAADRVPGAPTNIQATALAPGQGVEVSWTRQEQNATQFRIMTSYTDKFSCGYYCYPTTTYSYVAAPLTSYIDKTSPQGSDVTYRVSACDKDGCIGSDQEKATATVTVGGPYQISGKILAMPDYEPLANAKVEIFGPAVASNLWLSETPIQNFFGSGAPLAINTSSIKVADAWFQLWTNSDETLPAGDFILVSPSDQEIVVGRTEQMSDAFFVTQASQEGSPLAVLLGASLEQGTWKVKIRFDDPAQAPSDEEFDISFYVSGEVFKKTAISDNQGRYALTNVPYGKGYLIKVWSSDDQLIGSKAIDIRDNVNSFHFIKNP